MSKRLQPEAFVQAVVLHKQVGITVPNQKTADPSHPEVAQAYAELHFKKK